MATDSISGMQKEVQDTLAVLNPQIQGINDLLSTSISNDLGNALRSPALEEMNAKQSTGNAILADIDKLLADIAKWELEGGASPMSFPLPAHLESELEGQVDDVCAGASVFGSPSMATTLEVHLGEPVPKTNP